MTQRKLTLTSLQQYIAVGLIAVAAIVGTFILAAASSMAQESSTPATANTLQVSPVRSDVTVNPGETKIVRVTITNPTDSEVAVKAIQNDFVAGDEAGTPALILDETEYAPSNSLKRFLKPLESLTLAPREAKTIDVEVTVPEGAEAGGYFGAIRFAPTSPDGGGQVNLSPSVASLVLLTVSGDAPEKLTLAEFAVQQGGRERSFFTDGDSLSATARFTNEGNVQLGPFGKVSVKRGDTVVYETDFNNKTQRDVVLPDSARRWNIPLEGVDGFGHYTVSATFTYGAKNQSIEIVKSFWVIPASFIIAAIVLVVVIVGAIVGLILLKRHRSKNGVSLGGRSRR